MLHTGSTGVVPQDAEQGTGGSEPCYRSPHKPHQGYSAHQATQRVMAQDSSTMLHN